MEQGDQDMPHYRLQASRSDIYLRRSRSLRRSGAFQIILFSALAFLLIYFLIPRFLSTSSQIFRPHSVKRSWDSINLVLVLFAIICGFLSRNNSDNDYKYENSSMVSSDRGQGSNTVTPRQWYSDQTVYNRFGRLRSSSSYPDLRMRESTWVDAGGDDERWRSYDDTRVYDHRFDTADQFYRRYTTWQEAKVEEDLDGGGASRGADESKETEVAEIQAEDQNQDASSTLPPPESPPPQASPSPPPAPPSPPPAKVVKVKPKRVYQDLAPKEEISEPPTRLQPSLSTPPPAPPPPPQPIFYEKSKKNEKKRGGATKEFLIALRRKKKKQRQKSVDNLDILFGSPSQPPQSTPPPPPPPPPPHFFHSLFSSKKGKHKRSHSADLLLPPSSPPSPPPSHRPRRRQSVPPPLESRASKVKTQKATTVVQKSTGRISDVIKTTGNESPLIPIPPPPPPPPFKMPAWRFVVEGDYARLASRGSSRGGSPDLEEVEESKDTPPSDGGDSPVAEAPMFWPSPDVDTKADNFIARFRAGLKLEKMNSVNERLGRGRSNLGPRPDPDQDPVEGSR